MAEIAQAMLKDALTVFAEFDQEKAKSIWTRDLEVDKLHGENNQSCQNMVEKDASMASTVFETLFISKSIERVADHAVKRSPKEAVFMATSHKDVRHAPEYKKSELRKEIS